MALPTAIKPEKIYSLYNNIEDFTFSMPGGWDDYTISVFLEACHRFIEDLRNHQGDFMRQWSRIVRYGIAMTSNLNCFNITVTMELAKVLKAYLLKNKNTDEYVCNAAFKDLLNDSRDLLEYFPNANESQIPALQLKKCDCSLPNKPASVVDVIKKVSKQYRHLFGAKGIPASILWSEMSQKVSDKAGLKIDVKQHLERIKVDIVDKMKECNTEDQIKKFLTLAKDHLAYFDYIPPRNIKKSEFLPPNMLDFNGEEDVDEDENPEDSIEVGSNQILEYVHPVDYIEDAGEDFMEVDNVGAYCEVPFIVETKSNISTEESQGGTLNSSNTDPSKPPDLDFVSVEYLPDVRPINSLSDVGNRNSKETDIKTDDTSITVRNNDRPVCLNLKKSHTIHKPESLIIHEGAAVTTERLHYDESFCSPVTVAATDIYDNSYIQPLEVIESSSSDDDASNHKVYDNPNSTIDCCMLPDEDSFFEEAVLIDEPSYSSNVMNSRFPLSKSEFACPQVENTAGEKYLNNKDEPEYTLGDCNPNRVETMHELKQHTASTSPKCTYPNYTRFCNNAVSNDVLSENNYVEKFSETLCISRDPSKEETSEENTHQYPSYDLQNTIQVELNPALPVETDLSTGSVLRDFPDLTKYDENLLTENVVEVYSFDEPELNYEIINDKSDSDECGKLTDSLENLMNKSRSSSPLTVSDAVEKILIEEIQNENSCPSDDSFFCQTIPEEESRSCSSSDDDGGLSLKESISEENVKSRNYPYDSIFSEPVSKENESNYDCEDTTFQETLPRENTSNFPNDNTFEETSRNENSISSHCSNQHTPLNEKLEGENGNCNASSSTDGDLRRNIAGENKTGNLIQKSVDGVEDNNVLRISECAFVEKQPPQFDSSPTKLQNRVSRIRSKSEDSMLLGFRKSTERNILSKMYKSGSSSIDLLTSSSLYSTNTSFLNKSRVSRRNSKVNENLQLVRNVEKKGTNHNVQYPIIDISEIESDSENNLDKSDLVALQGTNNEEPSISSKLDSSELETKQLETTAVTSVKATLDLSNTQPESLGFDEKCDLVSDSSEVVAELGRVKKCNNVSHDNNVSQELETLCSSPSHELEKLKTNVIELKIKACEVRLNRVGVKEVLPFTLTEGQQRETETSLTSVPYEVEKTNADQFPVKMKECEVLLKRLNDKVILSVIPQDNNCSIEVPIPADHLSKLWEVSKNVEHLGSQKSETVDGNETKLSSSKETNRLIPSITDLSNDHSRNDKEVELDVDLKLRSVAEHEQDNSEKTHSKNKPSHAYIPNGSHFTERRISNEEINICTCKTNPSHFNNINIEKITNHTGISTNNNENKIYQDNVSSKALNSSNDADNNTGDQKSMCCHENHLHKRTSLFVENIIKTNVNGEMNKKEILKENRIQILDGEEGDRTNMPKENNLNNPPHINQDKIPLPKKRKKVDRTIGGNIRKRLRSYKIGESNVKLYEQDFYKLKKCTVVLQKELPYPYDKLIQKINVGIIPNKMEANLNKQEKIEVKMLDSPQQVVPSLSIEPKKKKKNKREELEEISNKIEANLNKQEKIEVKMLDSPKQVVPSVSKAPKKKKTKREELEEIDTSDDDSDTPFLGFESVSETFKIRRKRKLNFESDNIGRVVLNDDVVVLKKAVVVLRDFIHDFTLSLETDPKRHVCSCSCYRLMKEKCMKSHLPNLSTNNITNDNTKESSISDEADDFNSTTKLNEDKQSSKEDETNTKNNNHPNEVDTLNSICPMTSIVGDYSDDNLSDSQNNFTLLSPDDGSSEINSEDRLTLLGNTSDAAALLQEYRLKELSASKALRDLLDCSENFQFDFGSDLDLITDIKYNKLKAYAWFKKFIVEYRKHQNWKAQLKWKMEKEIQETEKNKLQIMDKVCQLLLPKINATVNM